MQDFTANFLRVQIALLSARYDAVQKKTFFEEQTVTNCLPFLESEAANPVTTKQVLVEAVQHFPKPSFVVHHCVDSVALRLES
jgi:hypothetical protein